MRIAYFIQAIGLKWMAFQRDPQNSGSLLRIFTDNQRRSWPVDDRICSAQISVQNYVNGSYIDTHMVNSLDFWSSDPASHKATISQIHAHVGELLCNHSEPIAGDYPIDLLIR